MAENHSILCVDDEASILKMLKRLLEGQGYQVFTCPGGKEALELLEHCHVDLILSDQRMPGMSGSEFLRIVKDKSPHVVRIMMSGYSDFDSLVAAVNEGEIFRFISKPWDQEQFLALLRLALAQKDVVTSIENIIKDVCKIAKLVDKVSVDAPTDSQCLRVKIGGEEDVFHKNTIMRFLNTLFDALGLQEKISSIAGAVARKNGIVSVTVDIGRGIALKIELPKMEE